MFWQAIRDNPHLIVHKPRIFSNSGLNLIFYCIFWFPLKFEKTYGKKAVLVSPCSLGTYYWVVSSFCHPIKRKTTKRMFGKIFCWQVFVDLHWSTCITTLFSDVNIRMVQYPFMGPSWRWHSTKRKPVVQKSTTMGFLFIKYLWVINRPNGRACSILAGVTKVVPSVALHIIALVRA